MSAEGFAPGCNIIGHLTSCQVYNPTVEPLCESRLAPDGTRVEPPNIQAAPCQQASQPANQLSHQPVVVGGLAVPTRYTLVSELCLFDQGELIVVHTSQQASQQAVCVYPASEGSASGTDLKRRR